MFLCSSKIHWLLNFEEVCSLKCMDGKGFSEILGQATLKTMPHWLFGDRRDAELGGNEGKWHAGPV